MHQDDKNKKKYKGGVKPPIYFTCFLDSADYPADYPGFLLQEDCCFRCCFEDSAADTPDTDYSCSYYCPCSNSPFISLHSYM